MGLDWIAARKRLEDGTEVSPYESIGRKPLSREDPRTVAKFKEIYDSHRQRADEGGGHDAYREHWQRPFDTLLDHYIEEGRKDPHSIQYMDVGDGEQPPIGVSGMLTDATTSYRGKIIERYVSVPENLKDKAFGAEFEGEDNMMSPEYAAAYADELQHFIDHPDELECDDDQREEQVKDLSQAVAFLRFWSGKGHPIWCWY